MANYKENKTENLCFLFPPIPIFILIMYRNIKNNKNSAFIPHYMYKFVWNHIKSHICEITTYFCSFTVVENVMDGYFAVNFYFYFASVQRSSVKSL